MALTFDGGNYLSQSSALVTVAPLTLRCIVSLSSIAANAFIMGVASSTATHHSFFAIEFLSSSSKFCASISNDAGSTTDITAVSSQVVSTNTFYDVMAVFTSTTSRTCYVNGGNSGSSTVSVTPGTPDTSYIGNIKVNGAASTGAIGTIAFPAFWSVALTSTDALSQGVGLSALHQHPASLASYARLTGGNSPEPDMVKGSWTLVSG